jgi:DNA-binding MurR/RpiR family transcriptional regulator
MEKSDRLPASQKKVAQFLLENGRQVAFLTAQELADKVGVSLATVVRTVSHLGIENYQTLREKLSVFLMASAFPTWQELEESWEKPNGEDYFSTVVKENIEGIRHLITPGVIYAIDEAVSLINQARKIYVIGSRSSRAPAMTLYYAFQQFTWNTYLLGASGEDDLYENLIRVQPQDVLIAISNGYPYYAIQTINAVKFAKSNKVPVILLTDHLSNPCVPCSEIVVHVPKCEGHFSLVPLMTCIEAIVVGLGRKSSGEAVDKLRSLWSVLVENDITLGKKNP